MNPFNMNMCQIQKLNSCSSQVNIFKEGGDLINYSFFSQAQCDVPLPIWISNFNVKFTKDLNIRKLSYWFSLLFTKLEN